MTISLQESAELPQEVGPVPREAAQRVLDYLIFHRSLLGEQEGTTPLLARYLTLVRDLKDGVHIVIADPFQKATALLFELVLDEAFDPWEIDLVRFTQLYVERVKGHEEVDFAVAGRLVYMAWNILFLQSVGILKLRETPVDLPGLPDDGASPTSGDGYLGDLHSVEELDLTTSVLASPEGPALTPMVRHSETRPVSLLELVSAFGEAEEQARRSLRIQSLRERLREEQRAAPEVLVHGDIPERDLADAWEAARRFEVGTPFPFLSLWRPSQGRDRLVSIFLASLFLAKEGVLELRQGGPGEGVLELVRSADSRPVLPEVLSMPAKVDDLVLRVEAVLFASGKPQSVRELADALSLEDYRPVQKALKLLARAYDGRQTALEVRHVGERYALQLREGFVGAVHAVTPVELAPRTLKALTLIAYHQPMLQSLLARMLGEAAYEEVGRLKELHLIQADPKGSTLELRTTKAFAEYFGIPSTRTEEIRKFLTEKLGAPPAVPPPEGAVTEPDQEVAPDATAPPAEVAVVDTHGALPSNPAG